jgi:hypothetical protein
MVPSGVVPDKNGQKDSMHRFEADPQEFKKQVEKKI